MTGFRLGFIAASTEHTTQAGKIHSHLVSCAAHFIQHAGIAVLKRTNIDEFTESMLDRFEYRRDVLINEISERGIDVPVPEGVIFVMIPLETDNDMLW